jgi:hypothetical protein
MPSHLMHHEYDPIARVHRFVLSADFFALMGVNPDTRISKMPAEALYPIYDAAQAKQFALINHIKKLQRANLRHRFGPRYI